MQNRWHSHFLDRTLYYVCRAVSRQMENPSSKEVCVPDTPLEGDCGLLREEEASYGLRYRLPAVYGIFLMNFKEDGLESYGVVVSEIVEKEAMEYNLGGNTILWFSMVLIRR